MEDIEIGKKKAFEYQQQLLLKEIETIQTDIPAYDNLSFKIKGWAVTLWSVIVAWGAREQKTEVVGISILVVLAFWFLDTDFKRYQQRLMVRMGAIEDFLNGRGEYQAKGLKEAFEQHSFGDFLVHDPICRRSIERSKNLEEKYKKRTNFWRCFRLSNVCLIYLGLCMAALILVFKLTF
jgi:hypothetical protein